MLNKNIIPFVLTLLVLTFYQSLLVRGEFEFQTTYRIILHKDSSATWIIELSTPLLSEDDVGDFEEFRMTADKDAMLSSFKSTIDDIVSKASYATNRPMRAENFSLTIDLRGIIRRLGIIEYRFTWVNFSIKTSNTLEVGDVFEGGFYLFPDETLEIDYSELAGEYVLKLVSPRPSVEEASKTTWSGKLDFSDGEPRLVFQQILTVEEFSLSSNRVEKGVSISVHGKISPPIPGVTVQIVYRNPGGSETVREVTAGNDGSFSDNYAPEIVGSWMVSIRLPPGSEYSIKPPQPLEFTVFEEAGGVEGETKSTKPPLETIIIILLVFLVLIMASTLILVRRRRGRLPPPPEEYMISDEELVLRILRNSGGRLAQKHIKEATGFSKSKTSMVLNELQKKGLIRKIKRGREYIVELV